MGELSKWENTYFSLETFHFLHFFCIKTIFAYPLFCKKKNSKKKIGSPSEMGVKTKVSQCE